MNEPSALSQTRHRLSLFTERQPMWERSAIARLLSQSTQTSKADLVWRKFFSELAIADARDLEIDEPAASIHSYLFSKLARFEMPRVFPAMSRYRAELIAYMQRYLEHAFDAEQLDIMQSMQDWVKEKLPDGG